jgi:alpha-glucoside transport system substrate-binding protein
MRKHLRTASVCIALALVAAACTSGTTEDAEGESVVRVFGNYRGAEAAAFRAVLDEFTRQTGIETSYVGTAAFAARIQDRVRDGDPPDVALFPQPAILADMARAGFLVPLDGDVASAVEEGYADWALDLATIDGALYGAWYRLSVKSLVWYPPQVFAAQGYEVPATWDELDALTEQMVRDGFTPWCLGMESFAATGWVGTDWIEDLVLRLHGPDVYDRWTSGEIPFTDDRIRAAFAEFADVALQPGRVAGGRRAILSVPALAAIDPMFEEPPGCLLTRQASFQEGELPDEVTVGPEGDVDVFVLPAMDGAAAPLLASGEIAAAFTDSEETSSLLAYLASPESGVPWAAVGGYDSPHLGFDPADYGSDLDRRLGELVRAAEVVRFDGSDLMPPPVGTGTFWTGMIDLVAGSPIDRVLADIQAGYPEDSL